MVEIGGAGPGAQHEDPFREAGSRNAQRASLAAQVALMASTLRPRRRTGTPPEPADRRQRLAAEFDRATRDAPQVARFLWGGPTEAGGWQPGVPLAGTYQAWLRAAATVDADPYGARVMMELCRQRMAACPGGPALLRVYDEYLYQGMAPVEAMRQAWADTEPARSAAPAGRPHPGRPQRPELQPPDPQPVSLPVPVSRPGPAGVDRQMVVKEAAQLLGAAEVTMARLAEFTRRHGDAVASDGADLARQWLAEAADRDQINPEQHRTWAQLVDQVRGSRQHAQWRIDNGLAPAPMPGTDEHLAGVAGQHHRSGDRHLGNAVDNPRTTEVDEQAQLRQQAYVERKTAEVYDALAHNPNAGLRARAAAARPSPATIARAAPPPDLAGKRAAPVVAARPPVPGRS